LIEAIVESDRAAIPDHRSSPSTVLIVDDHQDKRHLLACILQKYNFSVLEAENGPIALSMLEEFQPDVVLLEVLCRNSAVSRFAGA
jgi:PleD family two-component response regulator